MLKQIWKIVRAGLMFVGKVNSILLLTVFYYIILGPVAVLKRFSSVFSKNLTGKTDSYWVMRDQGVETEETLLRQF